MTWNRNTVNKRHREGEKESKMHAYIYIHLKVFTCTFTWHIMYMQANDICTWHLDLPCISSSRQKCTVFRPHESARTMKSSYLLVMSSSCRSKHLEQRMGPKKKHMTSMFERIGNSKKLIYLGYAPKVCSNALIAGPKEIWIPMES